MKFKINKINNKILSVIFSLAVTGLVVGCSNNSNASDSSSNDSSSSSSNNSSNNNNNNNIQITIPDNIIPELTDDIITQIDNFNYKLDEYYITTWQENQFLSKDSYLVDKNFERVYTPDIVEYFNLELPDELLDMQIHFAIPRDLIPYLDDKISEDDLSILTVYTAVHTDDGVYISSKFDEGGTISLEEYQDFVNYHSWANGDINYLTTLNDSQDQNYKDIVQAIIDNDSELNINDNLDNLDVKYMAQDDKNCIAVIGNSNNPIDIRQYALQKDSNNNWIVLVEGLESLDQYIYVNYASTKFNLELLPPYTLAMQPKSYVSDGLLSILIQDSELITEDMILDYSCSSGSFSYLTFENDDTKLLAYINSSSTLDLHFVENYQQALDIMYELEKYPPTFIIKHLD